MFRLHVLKMSVRQV